MKKGRQPYRAMSVPPKNVPRAGPHPTPGSDERVRKILGPLPERAAPASSRSRDSDRFADPEHEPRGEQCRERVQAAGDGRRAGPEEKSQKAITHLTSKRSASHPETGRKRE